MLSLCTVNLLSYTIIPEEASCMYNCTCVVHVVLSIVYTVHEMCV